MRKAAGDIGGKTNVRRSDLPLHNFLRDTVIIESKGTATPENAEDVIFYYP